MPSMGPPHNTWNRVPPSNHTHFRSRQAWWKLAWPRRYKVTDQLHPFCHFTSTISEVINNEMELRETVADDNLISNRYLFLEDGCFTHWYLVWLTPMCRNDDPHASIHVCLSTYNFLSRRYCCEKCHFSSITTWQAAPPLRKNKIQVNTEVMNNGYIVQSQA